MTNELAIRILTGTVLGTTEQTQEAIKMAVKALSQPERKKGKWIHNGSQWKNRFLCSNCNFLWYFPAEEAHYCPSCGSYNGEENAK